MNTQKTYRGSPVAGLIGATVGFFFGSAAVSIFGPTAHHFKEALGLTPTLLGLMVAIPSLSGSILRIPFGAWVDTTGGKKPFTILMLGSIIGLAGLIWLVSNAAPANATLHYWLFIVFGLLAGCGIATFSVGTGQISYWYPQRKQGRALATYAGIGTLAPGAFALILPVYLAAFGFVSAYVAWTIFLVVGTILYLWLGKNAPYFQFRKRGMDPSAARAAAQKEGQEIYPSGTIVRSLGQSAKSPYTWILVALYFATFGGFLALTSWYPTVWRHEYGFDPIRAGIYTALIFSMLSAALRVVTGPFADRYGGRILCILAMILLAGGGLGMMFVHELGWSIFFTVVIALAMGVNNAAVFKLLPQFVPDAVGGASGWVGGIGAFSGFLLPILMGAFVSWGGDTWYRLGFIVFVVMAVINLILIFTALTKRREAALAQRNKISTPQKP